MALLLATAGATGVMSRPAVPLPQTDAGQFPEDRQGSDLPDPLHPGERVTLSPEGMAASRQGDSDPEREATPARSAAGPAAAGQEQRGQLEALGTEQQLSELKSRDREVRSHEQAHAIAGGQYAAAPHYEFKQGPDTRHYAVDGKVSIDISAVAGDPHRTIEKMETVIKAALAPAEPSSQDRQVAATASARVTEARVELAEEAAEAQHSETSPSRQLSPQPPATQQQASRHAAEGDEATAVTKGMPRAPAVEQAALAIANRYRLAQADPAGEMCRVAITA